MAENPNKLSQPINDCVNLLDSIIQTNLNNKNYLNELLDFNVFENKENIIEDCMKNFNFDYKINGSDITSNGNIDDDKKKSLQDQMDLFNESLDKKTKEFVISSALQLIISKTATEYLACKDSDLKVESEFNGYSIYANELKFYNSLSILLDYEIYLLRNTSCIAKSTFFSSLSQIFDFLLNLGGEYLDKFWYYLESRKQLIQNVIFDKNVIGDRIAILEICNKLTDEFKFKTIQSKSDSYKKDSFNDKFQYRVRIFISNLLALEDNTGLNKYFQTSNRVVNEVAPTSKYKHDAELLKDLIQLQKVFNDPYFYLKSINHRATQKMVEIMRNVYQFLVEEEISIAKKQRKQDPFLIKPQPSEAEKSYLIKKFNDRTYFPEKYWLSPFHESRRDSSYDENRKEDLDAFHSQLNSSSFRRTYLLKIYIICNLFYELNSINKRDFLKSINVPSNTKHITDDSPPDNLVNSFFKIKRELPKKMRDVDNQFSFLLQHISITEIFWWGWLIYGKDIKGKPLFQDKELTVSELKSVQEKSTTVIPYKVKRYFNLYATPQLSRKMKVETGLSKLSSPASVNLGEYEESLAQLNDKLTCENTKDRESILEKHNVVMWKYLKAKRSEEWLQFGSLLNKSMLTYNTKEVSKAENNKFTDSTDSSELHIDEQGKRILGDSNDIDEPSLKKTKIE